MVGDTWIHSGTRLPPTPAGLTHAVTVLASAPLYSTPALTATLPKRQDTAPPDPPPK